MTSRSRERRAGGRLPGIWRGGLTPPAPLEQPPAQHGARNRGFLSWRIVSALLLIILSGLLFLFFTADAFYVHSIAVGGLNYMSREEVFALTEIADMHVFWVEPTTVRQSLLRSSSIADADVQIGWPPVMVRITIEEREPALIWEQSGVPVWIDVQGRVMRLRADRPDLLRVVAENDLEGVLDPNLRIDPNIVSGALQIHSLIPQMQTLRFDPNKGLGYGDGRGWDAWFGTGTDMPEKILIYNAIIATIRERGIEPSEISVTNPDAPYYCSLSSGCPGGS